MFYPAGGGNGLYSSMRHICAFAAFLCYFRARGRARNTGFARRDSRMRPNNGEIKLVAGKLPILRLAVRQVQQLGHPAGTGAVGCALLRPRHGNLRRDPKKNCGRHGTLRHPIQRPFPANDTNLMEIAPSSSRRCARRRSGAARSTPPPRLSVFRVTPRQDQAKGLQRATPISGKGSVSKNLIR